MSGRRRLYSSGIFARYSAAWHPEVERLNSCEFSYKLRAHVANHRRRIARRSCVAYVQLMRLPNVFTALADVLMGYLFTHDPDDAQSLAVGVVSLLVASALLYTAGMVLNDVFDVEVDRVERPERPLPSGRIPVGLGALLGFEMLFFGAVAGVSLSVWSHDLRPAAVSIGLAVLIVLYDGRAEAHAARAAGDGRLPVS